MYCVKLVLNSESTDHHDPPRSKLVSKAVLNVDDVKSAVMTLTMSDETNTTQVVTASYHTHVTCQINSQHTVNTMSRPLCLQGFDTLAWA